MDGWNCKFVRDEKRSNREKRRRRKRKGRR